MTNKIQTILPPPLPPSSSQSENNPSIVNSVTNDEDDDSPPNTNWIDFNKTSTHNNKSSTNDIMVDSILPPPLPRNETVFPIPTTTSYSRNQYPQYPHQYHHNEIQKVSPPPLQPPQAAPLTNEELYLMRYEANDQKSRNRKSYHINSFVFTIQLIRRFDTRPSHHHQQQQQQQVDIDIDTIMHNSLSKEFRIVDLQQIIPIIEQQEITTTTTAAAAEDKYKLIKTDQQFMFVLKTICSSFDADDMIINESSSNTHTNNTNKNSTTTCEEETISWGEFLQFYRMCVVGMQTLEALPTGTLIRNRAKDRTLRMLSLFGTQSKYCNNNKKQEFKDVTINNMIVGKDMKITKDVSYDVVPQDEWKSSRMYQYVIFLLAGVVMIASVIGFLPSTHKESSVPIKNSPMQHPHFQKETLFNDVSQFHLYPHKSTGTPITPIYATSIIKTPLYPSMKTTSRSSIVSLSGINLQSTKKTLIDNEAKTALLDTKLSLNPNFTSMREMKQENSFHRIDATATLGGSTALLYLLLPVMKGLVSVTGQIVAGWIPISAMAVFIVSLIGQDIRKLFLGTWKKISKRFSQFN